MWDTVWLTKPKILPWLVWVSIWSVSPWAKGGGFHSQPQAWVDPGPWSVHKQEATS